MTSPWRCSGTPSGTPDILEAIVHYLELQTRVAAVISAAGAVGGSPLANDASESMVDLLQYFPGTECDPGDEYALESLKPEVRQRWLADHPLPDTVRYYSLATLPDEEQISAGLKSSYRKLARVDARSDSQLIFYDQIVPGSTLLGYLNADHWALYVAIGRSHKFISVRRLLSMIALSLSPSSPRCRPSHPPGSTQSHRPEFTTPVGDSPRYSPKKRRFWKPSTPIHLATQGVVRMLIDRGSKPDWTATCRPAR